VRYDDFKDFRGLGAEFYHHIRCGISHQAEAQNGWLIERKGDLDNVANRTINSTRFRKRMRKCLQAYCSELGATETDNDIWGNFKTKMAYVIQNCHAGEIKL